MVDNHSKARTSSLGVTALATALVLLLVGCALQEDLVSLDEQVGSLQGKVDTNSAKTKRLGDEQAMLREKVAEMHTLVNDLRDEIMGLRGEQEKGLHEASKGMAGFSKLEGGLEAARKDLNSSQHRIDRIERYLGMAPEKPAGSTSGETPQPKGESHIEDSPEVLYGKAEQSFEEGNYEDARQLFRAFLEKYPKSEKAENSQFRLGEIYFHEKWYEKAILEYQKVIEQYPKGARTPSALLKQGLAFLSLDDAANARLILKELIRKFPDSNEANVAKNKLKTLK